MSLVTVCIAASDRVDLLLSRCLPSILRQTHQDFEVSIVGDCVDEAKAERLRQIDDPRVSFVNLPQRGPYPPPGTARWQVAGSNAMNAAMARAKGEYICHIDDDDELLPDKLERCLEASHNGSADFVWHQFYTQLEDFQWVILGNGEFALGQITTGAAFYTRKFADVTWDVYAFRRNLPGDWDRFKRIDAQLKPRKHFITEPLLWHYKESNYQEFIAKPGETFLES